MPPGSERQQPISKNTDKRDAELLLQLMLEKPLLTDLATHGGATGPAAVADASPSAGADAHASEEPVASRSHERRHATQAAAVERGGQAEFLSLSLPRWSDQRRRDLLSMLQELDARILPLDRSLKQQAEQRPEVRLLMTHPGVGPVVAMAFALTLGDPERFASSKQVASYLGLWCRWSVPAEDGSGWGTSPNRAAAFSAAFWWKVRE